MLEDITDGVLFYFLRREAGPKDKTAKRGIPYATVAVRMNDDGTVNRGIAVCSPKDRYDRKAGRGIALSRLLAAEAECKDILPFGYYDGAEGKSHAYSVPFTAYRGGFHDEPTSQEFRMFTKPEETTETN